MCPGQEKSDLEAASRKIDFTDMAMILVVLALPEFLLATETRYAGCYAFGTGDLSRITSSEMLPRWIIMLFRLR